MEPLAADILGFLDRVRQRELRLELGAGLCLALAWLLLLGLGLLALGPEPLGLGWVRSLALSLAAAGLLAAALRHGWLPRRRLGHGAHLARVVEGRLGGMGLELVSAAELALLGAERLEAQGMSPALAEAHLGRVAGRLAVERPAGLVPPGRLASAAGLACLLALGLLAAAAGFPERAEQAWAALQEGARADPGQAVAGPSWLGDLELAYRYPAYSGRPERVVPGADGAILALPGTEVKLRARADRPLRGGALRLGEQQVPLRLEGAQAVTGSLLVMASGEYRFELESVEGERWQSPRGLPIRLEPDRPPEVRLMEPARDQVVRETDSLELLFDARDDFGLTELALVWRVVGRPEGEQRRPLGRPAAGSRAERRGLRWELGELALQPGEQVQVAVEAQDSDTVQGPKAGRSAAINLKVFSAEEHHRALMAEVQALWEQLVLRLGDHLDGEPGARGPGPAPVEELAAHQRLAAGLDGLRQETERLGRALAKDERAFRPLGEALGNLQAGLAGLGRELGWLLESAERRAAGGRQDELRLLASHRGRRIQRLERDVLYLEDLLDLERLRDIERLAGEMDAAERRLRELMEAYRQAPSDEARRRIEAEIARLKARLGELLARQAEVLKELRDEYLNPEALKKLASQRDALSALDRMQALLQEGKLDEAMRELGRLRQQLDSLQGAIQQAQRGYGDERYQELSRAAQGLQAELRQLAEAQRAVEQETGELKTLSLEKLAELQQKGLRERLRALGERARRLRQHLEAIPAEDVDEFRQPLLERLQEDARVLERALEEGELAQAIAASRGERLGTEGLREGLAAEAEMEEATESPRAARLREDARRAAAAAEEAEAIHAELAKLMPPPERLLSPEQRGRMRKLEGRQRELRGKLRALRGDMERLNQKAPIFGEDMLQGAERGGSEMQQASDELGVFDPRAAHPHQQAARQQLERMQQAMEQAAQSCPRGGGGMPLPMGSAAIPSAPDEGGEGQANVEKVHIPGAEEYRPPEAFREELLRGMKDPVPEDYQPLVRRYYEELVR
ncbi:MAG TPA: hypothetical protein PK668_02220 [Myxococcota bacterium]|nr:hypothetical protein [Myxococcota bacterium]HRY94616.1 hypothetical protein [Myxococcota bacterium]HSA20228.1 hypothetical protein [Myxococcota bacterium]